MIDTELVHQEQNLLIRNLIHAYFLWLDGTQTHELVYVIRTKKENIYISVEKALRFFGTCHRCSIDAIIENSKIKNELVKINSEPIKRTQ